MMEIFTEALEFIKTAPDTSAEDDSVHENYENSTYVNNLVNFLSQIHAHERAISVYSHLLEIIPETEFKKTYINETIEEHDEKDYNKTPKIDMKEEYNKIIHQSLLELQYSNKTAYLEIMKQYELLGRHELLMKKLKDLETNKSMNKEYKKEIHHNGTVNKKIKHKNETELKEVDRNTTINKEIKEQDLNSTMNNELEETEKNITDVNIGELKEEHNKTEKGKHKRRRERKLKKRGGLSLTFFPII